MQVFTQSTSVLNLLRGVFMFLIFVSPAKVTIVYSTKNIVRVRKCPDITIGLSVFFVFFAFLSFSPDITLIKCLKGLKS